MELRQQLSALTAIMANVKFSDHYKSTAMGPGRLGKLSWGVEYESQKLLNPFAAECSFQEMF